MDVWIYSGKDLLKRYIPAWNGTVKERRTDGGNGEGDESKEDRLLQSWRSETGNLFQTRGDACRNERCVIFKERLVAFINFEPVERFTNQWDMRWFGGFDNITSKRILTTLETFIWDSGRLKAEVQRVGVIKFRVNNRGCDGSGCFEIRIRTDALTLTIISE